MSVSNPKVTTNIVGANVPVQNSEQIVLIVGQMLSSGTAIPGTVYPRIGNDSAQNTLFGEGSQVSEMIRAFKTINKVSRLDVLPLADPEAGTAITVETTFSGTATNNGTFNIIIGSLLRHNYNVVVKDGDTAKTVADNIAETINEDEEAYFTATAADGVLTITCKHKGVIGNDISAMFVNPTGVAGILVSVPTLTLGNGLPTFPDLNTVCGSTRYQTVVWPYQYPTNVVCNNFLEPRWNPNNAVLDGVAIVAAQDTFSSFITLGNSLNLKTLVYLADQLVSGNFYAVGSIVEWKCVLAATFAAVRALRLTPNTSIAQYVTTTAASDQFGGPALASLPYFNTPFPTLPLVNLGYEWSQEEIDELQAAGISTLQNNIANNTLIAGTIVTTYKTNAQGSPDPSFTFLNYVDTMSNVREYMSNNLKADCAQARLTAGDIQPGRSMENIASIRAKLCGYYQVLGSASYVLVASGQAAMQTFRQNLVVGINLASGTCQWSATVQPDTQLREILGTIGMSFSVNS